MTTHVTTQRSLFYSLLVTGFACLVELVGGFYTNSLALIGDAGHMFFHLFSLLLSFFASQFALRPATKEKTYGFHRLEILAAVANGVLLVALAILIMGYAIQRLLAPVPITSQVMLWIAGFGLVVNLWTAYLLHAAQAQNLNIKAAFLHVLSDTLSSVAVLAAAGLILVTNWSFIDPLVSLLIAILILFWAFSLLRESIDILLEGTPKHLSLAVLRDALLSIEGIARVHDLHAWTITSGMYALSAHLCIDETHYGQAERLLQHARELLCEQFHIEHTTLQLEQKGCELENVHD